MAISAADVKKLRTATGAGMMDCKKALTEANGDFDTAVQIIREKGKAIANKRADRDAAEGVVLTKISEDGKRGSMVVINCETDFVAKNEDFVAFANKVLDVTVANDVADLESAKALDLDGHTVAEQVTERTGVIGEKVDFSNYLRVDAEYVVGYIHPGNKLATLVGFSKAIDASAARDIAMQAAAMNPVAVDKDGVPAEVAEKELEIAKEKFRQEGKPEAMLDKIAQGSLNKFFKENTLVNQAFVKDSKQTVAQYLKSVDADASVVAFKRFSLDA